MVWWHRGGALRPGPVITLRPVSPEDWKNSNK
eukprot:CAMPEP_0202812142 /NCGR_PEP_ID=MMETSP1389-20130828/3848_1 /ASSEMBLY_ACC=CAM_ASM_000865 /TAXON_ID=302021 /ORGANISM="Rhodomonas sp., Strain CCMP768" /LENGTH=31 /DNA_ID= /DNA_START= /DNA_END= /DNA_ORIENTATION=